MELVEFLLARIAEDEAAAAAEAIAQTKAGTVVLGPAYDDHPGREALRDQMQEAVIDARRTRPWNSSWPVVRVLVECEAKRRIVERCEDLEDERMFGMADDVMRALATVYADHTDYDEAWRP